MRALPSIVAAAGLVAAIDLAFAQQSPITAPGYRLTPVETYKDVSRDPDGIWPPSELSQTGLPKQRPTIYTARVSTPTGEWIISQADNSCSMTSDCSFKLALKRSDGSKAIVAEGQLALGGTAVLAMDYSKLFVTTYNGVETVPVKVPR